MADPRKRVSFAGIGQKRATFLYGNTIVFDELAPNKYDGLAVKISADDTIQLVSDGDPVYGFVGVVERDGFATIIYDGFVENAKKGDGATLTPGLAFVGALGASSAKGRIKNAAGFTGQTAALDGNAAAGGVAVTIAGAIGRGFVVNDGDSDGNNVVVCLTR